MDTKEKKKGKTPMDAALHHLTARARTVLEMERYLDSRQYGEYEVMQVVERLKELHYLDDEAFARDFVRSRLATKPISKRKLKEQLMGHMLPKDMIEEALEEVTDEVEAKNAAVVAEKFARQFASLPAPERRQRILRRLFSHGYTYDAARAAMDAVGEALAQEEYAAASMAEDEEL